MRPRLCRSSGTCATLAEINSKILAPKCGSCHGASNPAAYKNISSRTPTVATVAWDNVPACFDPEL